MSKQVHWTIKATKTEDLVMVYWKARAKEENQAGELLLLDAIKIELQTRGYQFGILTIEVKPVWVDNLSTYNVIVRYGEAWNEVKRGFGDYLAALEWGRKRMDYLQRTL